MIERSKLRLLLIDDDEDDYVEIKELLGAAKGFLFSVDWVSRFDDALPAIERGEHDVYLIDYRLGKGTGLDLIQSALSGGVKGPMILLTGFGDHEVDLKAMKIGAADYLVKGQINAPLLERSIRYSMLRSKTLETIRQREENFRSLLNSAFEGIVVHEMNGEILDANHAAARILGLSGEGLVGKNLFALTSPRCKEFVAQMLEERSESSYEVQCQRKDGASIHLEVRSKPYTYQGKAAALTAVRDVSGQKQMQAQIMIQDRLASIGLMASSLAHEIGTPLGVIRGRAEYLSMQVQDDATRKSVDVIVSQIDRISKLIRSLLNLARGDGAAAGVGKVELQPTIRDVLDLMAHEFSRAGITIENQLESLPALFVRAEAQSLHQVFLNLLVNSVHAIQSESKAGRTKGHSIRIGFADRSTHCLISVEDSGCGISQENQKNLFKPFFTTKDIGAGTGLGLATIYWMIKSWHGSIEVESQEGKGTSFRLILPKG